MLAAANLLFGELNQDEGWYLYAARLVREGDLPYRDFAFTQGPLMPIAYALLFGAVERWGVGGGRAVTALMGLAAAALAVGLARRLSPAGTAATAGVFTLALVALNVYHSYFTTVVKTYSLCALFFTGGFYALSLGRERRSAGLFAAAGLLLSAAAAVRLSFGLALAVVGVWLLVKRRRYGDAGWLAFGLGGGLGLALFLGTFYLAAPDNFRFYLIDYHTARDSGGLFRALAFKAGMVSRLVQGYFVATALGISLLVLRVASGGRAPETEFGTVRRDGEMTSFGTSPAPGKSEPPTAVPQKANIGENAPPERRENASTAVSHVENGTVGDFATVAGLAVGAIALAQAAAPFPYDDYQVPLFPLFAALVSSALFRLPALAPARAQATASVLALLLNGAAAISSPINQAWLIVGRDRIWWRMREEPALVQLRRASERLRNEAGTDGLLLTQDTYLAVDAGLRVPRGWEMGVFSYYPDWPRETAEQRRVVNREMLLEQIRQAPARVAAFSDYAFSIAAPRIVPVPEDERMSLWQALESRYTPLGQLSYFGQGNMTLRLYVRSP